MHTSVEKHSTPAGDLLPDLQTPRLERALPSPPCLPPSHHLSAEDELADDPNVLTSPRGRCIVDKRELMIILEAHRDQILASVSGELNKCRTPFMNRTSKNQDVYPDQVGKRVSPTSVYNGRCSNAAQMRSSAAGVAGSRPDAQVVRDSGVEDLRESSVQSESSIISATAVLHKQVSPGVKRARASCDTEGSVAEDSRTLTSSQRLASSGRGRQSLGSECADVGQLGEQLRTLHKQIDRAYNRPLARAKFKKGDKDLRAMSMKLGAKSIHVKFSAVVAHPWFDAACAFMILFNSVLIGVVTNFLANNPEEETWMMVCGYFCSIFFFVELVLRIVAQGKQFFTSEEKLWNAFDFALVFCSIIDFILEQVAVTDGGGLGEKALKVVKMLRIARIFRQFRFFQELSVLAIMIADSMKSLTWALVLLSMVIYVFAVVFTSGATDWRREAGLPHEDHMNAAVRLRFGSLGRSGNTLIISMLNGVSWGEVSGVMENMGWLLVSCFFFYIFFTMFAVLNVITGVFVDNAMQTANSQREFLVERERSLKEALLVELRELFKMIDEDGSGSIGHDELVAYLEDQRTKAYFEVLGIDPDDTSRLFHLIDVDGSGEVDVEEFLEGCLRLKGVAQSIDVHSCMHLSSSILTQINLITRHLGLERNDSVREDTDRESARTDRVSFM